MAISRAGQQAFQSMEDSPKPIVAAIMGSCLGGGLEVGDQGTPGTGTWCIAANLPTSFVVMNLHLKYENTITFFIQFSTPIYEK